MWSNCFQKSLIRGALEEGCQFTEQVISHVSDRTGSVSIPHLRKSSPGALVEAPGIVHYLCCHRVGVGK